MGGYSHCDVLSERNKGVVHVRVMGDVCGSILFSEYFRGQGEWSGCGRPNGALGPAREPCPAHIKISVYVEMRRVLARRVPIVQKTEKILQQGQGNEWSGWIMSLCLGTSSENRRSLSPELCWYTRHSSFIFRGFTQRYIMPYSPQNISPQFKQKV